MNPQALLEYTEGTVYVVHLDPPYRRARHYVSTLIQVAYSTGWPSTTPVAAPGCCGYRKRRAARGIW